MQQLTRPHEGARCVRGCMRRNRHTDLCRDDDCTGCIPRTAQFGNLCWPCHRRLEEWLSNGENSLAHAEHQLHTNLTKNGGGGRDVKITRPEPDREPINLARYDQLQLLRDRLSGWLELHCAERNLTGPDVFTVRNSCAYLAQWVDKLEESPWVGDMWEELAEVMRDAHALAPWRAQLRRCKGVPCPECEQCKLVIYGGDDHVTCQTAGCGMIYTREQYDRWTELLAWENSQERGLAK